MQKEKALEILNSVVDGFTSVGDMFLNPAINGCIIDRAFVTGKWFVVFNDSRDTVEGLSSLNDAIKCFIG